MLDEYYYCLNCHSEITPDYNEHCTFCGCSAIAVSGDYSNEEVEKAFDLLNKEQQGLVIVPPCKVGDKVYKISRNKVKECEVIFIGISADEKCSHFNFVENYSDGTFYKSYSMVFDVIGKTVFLTKEEAEKALKARCGKL